MSAPGESLPRRRGIIFILSAPSGAGKTTISRAALKRIDGLEFSVSVTTRRPRGDETGGVDYQFVSEEVFSSKVEKGEFAEWVRNFDAAYGTPRAPLEAAVREGSDILLDIDIRGADSIRARYPKDSVTIFVMPPSFEELEGRLRKRATESEDKIQSRLRRAVEETRACVRFDYVIVNRDIDESLALLESIVNAERARVSRMPEGLAPWNK